MCDFAPLCSEQEASPSRASLLTQLSRATPHAPPLSRAPCRCTEKRCRSGLSSSAVKNDVVTSSCRRAYGEAGQRCIAPWWRAQPPRLTRKHVLQPQDSSAAHARQQPPSPCPSQQPPPRRGGAGHSCVGFAVLSGGALPFLLLPALVALLVPRLDIRLHLLACGSKQAGGCGGSVTDGSIFSCTDFYGSCLSGAPAGHTPAFVPLRPPLRSGAQLQSARLNETQRV